MRALSGICGVLLLAAWLAPRMARADVELTRPGLDLLPGASLADRNLQADTLSCVSVLEGLETSGCRDRYVVDTKVQERALLPMSWTERWTVNRCGKNVVYKIFYVVLEGSTKYIEVSGGTAGNWVAANDRQGALFRFNGGSARSAAFASFGKNYVKNGSFERDGDTPVSWSVSGTMGLSEEAKDGGRSLHANIKRLDPSVTIFEEVKASQVITGPESSTVMLSCWIKTEDVEKCENSNQRVKVFFHFRVKDKDGNEWDEWDEVGGVEGTRDWTRYQKEIWFRDRSIKTLLTAQIAKCAGEVWFDDVSVTKVPKSLLKFPGPPTEWSPAPTAGKQKAGEDAAEPVLKLVAKHRIVDEPTGQSRVSYQLAGSGFPSSTTTAYMVWSKPLHREPIPENYRDPVSVSYQAAVRVNYLGEFYADRRGRLTATGTGIRLDRCRFYARNYLEGQPYRLAVISADNKIAAYAKAVPFPIMVRGTGKCKLMLELANITGKDFVLYGEGYEPYEEIDIGVYVGGEMVSAWKMVKAGSDGRFMREIKYPPAISERGGDATFVAHGKTCRLSLHYKWGNWVFRR